MKFSVLSNLNPDIRTYKESPLIVDSSTLVGLEIELEEVYLPGEEVYLPHWKLKSDGSLKGEAGVEFIFVHPYAGYDIVAALDELIPALENTIIKPQCSERTSVHVHLDVRTAELRQLVKFALYYAIFERMLYRFANKTYDRYDNIFCIPLKEVMTPFALLRSIMEIQKLEDRRKAHNITLHVGDIPYEKFESYNRFYAENKRYCGFNLVSLGTLGSVEFRMHEGTYDKQEILDWINILLLLKKYSFESDVEIEEIPKLFSMKGIAQITRDIFGDYANKLIYNGCEEDCLDNIRHANLLFTKPIGVEDEIEALMDGTRDTKYVILDKIIKRQAVRREKLIRKSSRKEV